MKLGRQNGPRFVLKGCFFNPPEIEEHQICLRGTKHKHYAINHKCSGSYETGDYATALREWKPLAEQVNTYVQTNLGQMYNVGEDGFSRC